MTHNKTTDFEPKDTWIRTGKTIQENSVNNRGVITLAEEKSGKKTRLVATTYRTIEKKKKED